MAADGIRGGLNDATVLSLRSFVAVVETQSFSSAARQLRVAPSSVTKHIQMLETSVRVPLVHRTTRRVSVTDAGDRFYHQCLTILAQVDRATAAMAPDLELSGTVRVCAPPSLASVILAPNLHRFLDAHPALCVDLLITSALPDPVRDRVDIAFLIQEEPQTKLPHLLIAPAPRVLCASPQYLSAHGVPRTIGDLAEHRALRSHFSQVVETWFLRSARDGWTAIQPKTQLLSDNGEVLRQACLAAAGITMLYAFHVEADLAAGRLVRVLPEIEPKPRSIYAVMPHRQLVRPQITAFVAFAHSLMRAPSAPDATVRLAG